ncbi:unnamed protein product [Linum tenue]|uniref:Uncharacterized protein n=2 Tax=Linum tenue TaxID=586396 RepID=A0AAV0N198_9ROSI|nr:unnamed protein product [Linum tenue]
MAADGTKRPQPSILPPRKLNVQKFAESRASELDALHSIVSKRLKEDFRSQRNKRRRTTSYDNQAAKWRYRKRQKSDSSDIAGVSSEDNERGNERRVPRRVRRREELRKNPEHGFITSGDRTKRLRTHVWLAKRFTMTKLWGFHLPLGLHGRGKGSRAALRWFNEGAVVHDASYHSAVQLEGPEDSLLSVLRMVMVPSLSSQSADAFSSVLSGVSYGTAMLHHVGQPTSQAIAPVSYLWRPSPVVSGEKGGNEHSSMEGDMLQSSEPCCSSRQLWVWIHASAFTEGYDALKFVCQKMNDGNVSITCCSLEGQLAKIEVMGAKASQLLQRILHPISGTNSEPPCSLKNCSFVEDQHDSQLFKSSTPEHDFLPGSSLLYLTVKDPRCLHDNRTADPSESSPPNNVVDIEVKEKAEELLLLHESKSEETYHISEKNLWDVRAGDNIPIDEHVLCMEKHQMRRDYICVNDPKLGIPKVCTKVQGSRSCPILVLKNHNKKGQPLGWSIIVPVSWARIFWNQLVSKEAHAIGLREKQWIACEVGLPYFPSDFPDCNAYWSLKIAEGTSTSKKEELKPLAVKSFEVPIPPPWNTVRASLGREFNGLQVAVHSEKDTISSRLNGFVARTSSLMLDILKEIQGDNLFLFPQVPNSDSRLLASMKDEIKVGNGVDDCSEPINNDHHKLCFLRVLLNTFKEGVIEEGAVVCAPLASDISHWTKSGTGRLQNLDFKLRLPDSSVRSYFQKHSSGQWDLQIPQDPAVMESHRWPIGFVTTGFVRGIKKPTAEAFCEAMLLSRLREEQWKEMPVDERTKEIYVLVRNLRSSAYRLALATVVLEQQEHDVDFL